MNKIEIDDDVLAAIKAEAEPFVDTPNSALRRLLGVDAGAESEAQKQRAPHGSLLPESEYELPILQSLAEAGGSGKARDITQEVGKRLADRLTEVDHQPLKAGDIRWENRVAFVRLKLKDRGLLKSDSPRGVWELTDAGLDAAKAGEA